MRYSRFKKQMDGVDPVKRGPRKNKVEKRTTKSPKKVKDRKPSDDVEKIKLETPGPETPDLGGGGQSTTGSMDGRSPLVKTEPGVASYATPGPSTPHTSFSHPDVQRFESPSPTPSPVTSFSRPGELSDMDEMMASFCMPDGSGMSPGMSGPGMYHQPMMGEPAMGGPGYGIGMNMGLGDPYDGLWDPRSQSANVHGRGMRGDGNVMLKTEPRWEESYIRP
jgi:hypothetical protein